MPTFGMFRGYGCIRYFILFGGIVMKKMVLRVVLAMACMGIGVAFADDKGMMTTAQKDECLLISKDCKTATLSIQEKIKKLQTEIQKGKRVYTADELKKLEQKLKETETTLDELLTGP